MPTGADTLKAAQIVTQRVSVDDRSRRDAAEPIGRDFAGLVAEARTREDKVQETQTNVTPTNAADAPESSPQDEQFAFSNLLPEEEDASSFLVANAALSETTKPIAGLLNLAPEQPTPNATAANTAPQKQAAPTDVLVDTTALFLPPDPNKPIETTASVHSTQFGALSWPPPESAAALQTAATSSAIPTKSLGATLTAPTELATSTPNAGEGGPSSNRLAANLSPVPGAETASANSNHASSGSQTNNSGNASGASNQPSTAQSAGPATGAPTPLADAPSPLGNNGQLPQTPIPTSATTGASTVQNASASATPTNTPPPALASAPQAAVQVYSRFIERFDGRAQQYQIRLDPPELGRVNVRIEVGADHRVHAVLATSDSNALADLLRGQRALEQSLADAGIDLAEDGIRFELSDNGAQQSAAQDRNETTSQPRKNTIAATPEMTDQIDQSSSPSPRWSRSRVNIVA